jgi:membrane protein DedA with SNARE-associated domain
VTPMGALGALLLFIVLSVLGFILLSQSDRADTGVLAIVFCVTVVPILLLTIGLYLYARDREERLEAEE